MSKYYETDYPFGFGDSPFRFLYRVFTIKPEYIQHFHFLAFC